MATLSITVPSKPEHHGILVAFLESREVEGFRELETELVVFVDQEFAPPILEALATELKRFTTGPLTNDIIPNRNWNAEWENSIDSITAGGFWIRPTWNADETPEECIEVIIDPQMSFGTGYHESTRLMLCGIRDHARTGDVVLDAGTGTGVLAIAALKSGARRADVFDFDPICEKNARENAVLNDVGAAISVYLGDESVIPGDFYDLILANINREALRGMLPVLASKMTPGGRMGLSGLLFSDREIMLGAIVKSELRALEEYREGQWWSIWVTANG